MDEQPGTIFGREPAMVLIGRTAESARLVPGTPPSSRVI